MSSFGPPSLPPAGWYPDPERPGRQRWWDGSTWAPSTGTALPTDRYPDVGDLLGRAFSRAVRHWRSLVLVALFTSAPASVLVSLALRYAFDDVVVTEGDVIGWSNARIAPTVVMFLVAAALGLFGYLAVVWLTIRAVDDDQGRDPRHAGPARSTDDEIALARTAIVGAVRATGRAILWFAIVFLLVGAAGVAVVVLMLVAVPLGVLAILALIPIWIWVAIRWAFAIQAIVDGGGNPLRASSVVVRGRWWPTFGRLLLVGLVTGVVGSMINSASSLANGDGLFAGFGEPAGIELTEDGTVERFELDAVAPSTLAIVIGAVGALASAVFVSGVSGSATADMYRTRRPAGPPPR